MRTRDDGKRRQILEAATRVFTARRFHEATLDEVARVARVGKGTIYLHFGDKDALFLAAAMDGFEELCGELRELAGETRPFADRLLRACAVIGRFFERRRPLLRIQPGDDAPSAASHGRVRLQWRERRRALVDEVAALLADGQSIGEIRRDVPAVALAELLLGLLRARNRNLGDAASRPAESVVLDVYLRGAAAPLPVGTGPAGSANPGGRGRRRSGGRGVR